MVPQPQQQSGVAKIRPGRRGNKRPSFQEVFQNPAAADVNSSPSPNGSVDQIAMIGLAPSSPEFAAINRGKRSTKKGEKSNGARCLRGRPSELDKCYFVPDDDNTREVSGGNKTASNDPFWDASEAHSTSSSGVECASTPRRPSIADAQSTSLFKPSSSEENLASPISENAGSSTSDVQMCSVLLSSGDIGATSTDTDAQNLL